MICLSFAGDGSIALAVRGRQAATVASWERVECELGSWLLI
jgi:hypothetical protein